LIDDAFALAACFAEAIAQGHCFNDGNTRTAYWMNMQTNYDMSVASKVIDVSGIEPLFAA